VALDRFQVDGSRLRMPDGQGLETSVDEAFPPVGYTFEQVYIDEFGAFLKALDSRQEWYHPLGDGVQILRCLEAVKQSSAGGQRVEIGE
jgi:predicted dehydrogenase